MIIDTVEKYEKLPDFTQFKLVHTGDAWEDDKYEMYDVIKIGDKLVEIKPGGWLFSERNEGDGTIVDDFSFVLIK